MATFPGVATHGDIDALFDFASAQKRPAIAVLPGIRTEHQVAEQLLELAKGNRWRVRHVPRPDALATDDVFVGLEWQTGTPDLWSSPMGLAPLGTMPATRRAPYTCIAAWTGGRDNRFKKKIEPLVHFLDVDLTGYRLTSDRYKRLRKDSEKLTAGLLFDDSASHYRNVAFRLSAASAQALSKLPI
jgi:hypothetical protein